MTQVQAVIFDMDGTLFQTDKILELALDDTFAFLRSEHGWSGETPIHTYRKIMGVTLQVVWETLLPGRSDELRNIANEFFHAKLIANIRSGNGALYPHVYEVLDGLKQAGRRIFIASNGRLDYLSAIVGYYGLERWLTETFSIQQIDSQDKTDLVRHIMNKYGIVQAAVVGDRLSDIRAAKNNGLTAVGCRFDFAQEDELAQADAVIDDLLELNTVFNLR
ncbi:HAD family hydrolase [Paenibacillus sacheonensis]|uniref:HAD hydrolase-like protein n=1 Tax=Paenibacillus sacheonensis TaxID=742054 RepID=A0A7X4YL68_9BACL|nr:HAD family hydrolase [Paenibacillus sacheonensis]MBM7563097.1 adenosylhomocysteine nucleosidase [Paenibacillus sacheonensis]NBC68335.1 HAD hydrolase-like protein [Paenibacillus sacheonensis]